MRPLIAMSTSIDDKNLLSINKDYLTSVYQRGGLGVIISPTLEQRIITEYAEEFDGFIFCGGDDIDPKYYGEEKHAETKNICSFRDEFEYLLFQNIYMTGKPILAICRGAQVLSVFLGGNLFQHIEGHRQSAPRYVTGQKTYVEKGGFLYDIIGKEKIHTNSFHHQCVKSLGRGLVCDARSDDGYIEAWYSEKHPFCLGVQWHPENFYPLDSSSSKIFDAFISACIKGN